MKTQRISPHRKNVLFGVLKSGSSNAKWNADVMMDMFQLMRESQTLKIEDVHMVDPTLLSLVVDGNDGDSNHVKNIETLTGMMTTASLLMLPVFHSGAWSLMIYARDWKKWYICTSPEGNDSLRAMEIMYRFTRLGVVELGVPTVRVYKNLPNPEKGLHCLYYAFIHIYNYPLLESGDREAFEKEVGSMIHPEGGMSRFTEALKKLLTGDAL